MRYSIIRRQFKDENNIERKVIDYQLQQDKLIPLIADTYANNFGFYKMVAMAEQNLLNVKNNDFSLLGVLHGNLSCLKAIYTWSSV